MTTHSYSAFFSTTIAHMLQLFDDHRVEIENDCGTNTAAQWERLLRQMRAIPHQPPPLTDHPPCNEPRICISSPLATVLGIRPTVQLSRQQLEDRLWAYITAHHLHDPIVRDDLVLNDALLNLLPPATRQREARRIEFIQSLAQTYTRADHGGDHGGDHDDDDLMYTMNELLLLLAPHIHPRIK